MFTSLILSSLLLCSPISGNEARTVGYLAGNYSILGYHQDTDQLYIGTLSLSGAEDAIVLILTGEKSGEKFTGTVQYVQCGPDLVKQIEVKIDTYKDNKMYCVRHNNYANLSRLACDRELNGLDDNMEVWFQRYEP